MSEPTEREEAIAYLMAALETAAPQRVNTPTPVTMAQGAMALRTLGVQSEELPRAYNRFKQHPDLLAALAEDARAGISHLAGIVLGSPQTMPKIIKDYPGLAHAIDRVTRFADPPVDVYAHHGAIDEPEAGSQRHERRIADTLIEISELLDGAGFDEPADIVERLKSALRVVK